MALLGAIVNGLCIITGTLIGKLFSRIPDRIKETVMKGIGLAVTLLGIQMGLKSEQFLIVIFSLVIGAVIGEWLDIDKRLNGVGDWLEKKIGGSGGGVARGFVTATLIFVVGAMAIIGALDSGIRGNHSVLYTKSIIDGFTSLILATTLGIGVLFSFVPVVLYEGGIALFATQIERWVPSELMDSFIVEMTATGGLMIVAIGLSLLEITTIRVANLLPAIVVTAILTSVLYIYM
ncbi:DUF554 domain-containing protein [Bacillus sp. CGMCC 1.16541]|uniref:DUF554 domain-containing protein n=1 Tax=Bacillus sp. CGMCC 1.16541 TaxID=2185143 RepID=UPI000D731ADD|nr:DUF554 domain-containing protein [Bacillus sp. CGMCC 1.16541]